MRIVLDTNVLVSGVFFGGIPGRILEAWRDGLLQLVLSAEILDEYQRVGRALAGDYPGVNLAPVLELLTVHAEMVDAPALPERVCTDAADDMFLACALAAGVGAIVSGDRALLAAAGWRGLRVLRPREFQAEYLSSRSARP